MHKLLHQSTSPTYMRVLKITTLPWTDFSKKLHKSSVKPQLCNVQSTRMTDIHRSNVD